MDLSFLKNDGDKNQTFISGSLHFVLRPLASTHRNFPESAKLPGGLKRSELLVEFEDKGGRRAD